MKKIIIFVMMLFLFCLNSSATANELIKAETIKEAQTRIDKVGFKILNYNGIEKRTVFDFNTKNHKNAYTRNSDRQIVIYRGLYNRLESDDELAAILSHEIAHSVDSYKGIFRGAFFSWSYAFSPKKYIVGNE